MMILRQSAGLISLFLLSLLLANSLQNIRAEFGLPCTTIDVDNCTTGEECVNNNTCTCKSGYTHIGTSCLADLDLACDTTNGCYNTYANCTSGTCQCRTGYTKVGNFCKADLDLACDTTNGCYNTYANCTSGTCQCRTGYTKVGNFCKADLDLACDTTSGCYNTYANCTSGTCQCRTGYTKVGNFCKADLDLACDTTNGCYNTYASCTSGTCQCRTGYTKVGNFCKADLDLACDTTNGCYNTYASCTSGTCQCRTGYTKVGNFCKADLDLACDTTNGCYNTYASCTSGTCQCRTGYTKVGNFCKADLDLACDTTNGCYNTYASCTSGTCQCRTGYTKVGNFCKADLDLACDTTNGCYNTYASCTSGTCQCRTGYTKVGNFCKADLDLACDTTNGCYNTYASCTSGTCQCRTGYTKVGNFCKADLDLACDTTNGCYNTYASCTSGTCQCRTGYTKVGNFCKAELGYACNLNTPQVCNDGNATCDGTSGTCLCSTGYYNSSGVCKKLSLLKVKNLVASSIEENVLVVRWQNPDNVYDVSSFTVIRKRGSEISSPLNVSMNLTATLKNLTAGAAYTIQVNSFYGTTLGDKAEIQQATKPIKPDSIDVSGSNFDLENSGLRITWRYSGIITGIDVRFLVQLIDCKSSETVGPSIEVTTNNVSFPSADLKNGYWYNVSITATSEQYIYLAVQMRVNSSMFIYSFQTVVKAPEPPKVVQCSDIKDTSVNLTWQHPDKPNGDIRQYVVLTYVYREETTAIMSNNTTSPSESFVVTGLNPGKYYRFKVFTENELFLEKNGTWSQDTYCQTIANMSGPPVNLTVIVKTSRSFTLSWNQPSNINGELLGYVLKITKREMSECVMEEFTMCFFGCLSTFPNQTVIKPTCSQNISYSANKTELLTLTRIFTSSITPDTVYKVSVAAVNQANKGHTAELDVTTLEEVPQKPYNVQVTDVQATNATVEWSIDEPRPGNTTYTIIANGDSPAELNIYTIPGFATRLSRIANLQEYWHYNLIVRASTKLGSNESYSIPFNTTVGPAGNVSNFDVRGESGDDKSITAKVSWSLPGILERNGPISRFTVLQETMVNGTFVQKNSRNVTSDESNPYSAEFQVQREQLHRFIVFAFNGMDGAAVSMNYYAPAAEKPSSVGVLAGGIAGGAAALILIVVIIIVLWQRKSNKLKKARRLSDDATESNMENLTKIRKQRPINLATFAEYVADHHKDSNLKFSEEYDDLKTLSPQHPHEAADMEENRLKNRFVNILPFDHSRVRLLPIDDVPGSDYINANFLPGFTKTREYIACQGPIPATIDDHWRLTWEQNVRVIVMLTQYKEENRVKCEPYMPLDLKDPKQYGDLVVECLTYSSMNSFEYRTLKIKLGDKERTLKHFHFLSWRDYSANVQFDTMIDFIKKVRSFIQPPDLEGPMIVHCSAGVGRTGTYITIDHVIQHIDKYGPDSTVDIFNFVLKMRENRTTMVQTEQQYIFIHDCIKEYLDRFKTYENQAFSNEEENLYQNTETNQLYENFNLNSTQKTEL